MTRTTKFFFCSVVLASAAVVAQTQVFKPATIRFEGAPDYSVAELMQASGLKIGVGYSSDELNSHAQRLMDTGMFDKVGYKFDAQGMLFTLHEVTPTYPIVLENLPLPGGEKLEAALREMVPLYHGRVPSEGGVLEGVRQALVQLLAAEGADVPVQSGTVGEVSTQTVTAFKFSIPGVSVRVGSYALQGVTPELETKMVEAAKRGNFSYETGKTEQRMAEYFQDFLVNQGYATATVKVTRNGALTVSEGNIKVPVQVVVDAGRQYALGTVTLAEGGPVTQTEVEKAVGPLRPGESPWLRLPRFQGRCVTLLHARGYQDAVVHREIHLDEASGTANFTLTETPGPQYHLAIVRFENVSDDLRHKLMAQWKMLPGDPFDASYVGEFMAAMRTNDPVLRPLLEHLKATYDAKADPQTHDVTLRVVMEMQ